MIPWLAPLWDRAGSARLVEPFCGGLAVALGLGPRRALLNDANPHLINFYRWLQRGLVVGLELENDEERFYAYRSRFNELIRKGKDTSQEAAELFYYLNRTGYNGLCRFNKQGEFNVPFGRYKRINYIRDFSPYQHVLAKWEFTTGDFAVLRVEEEDFIYADPPYDVEFTEYAKDGFSWDDQVRLAHWLSRHPGPVVASNQATTRIRELYGDLGFTLMILEGPRRISCTGDRTPAKEILALRNIDFD